MRVPLSWLREFTDLQLSPEQLAEALTLRGLEVRGIERWGATWNHIVVGELLEVGPRALNHPGIARRAFFSAASVYQRWPDRNAVLDAVIRSDIDPAT